MSPEPQIAEPPVTPGTDPTKVPAAVQAQFKGPSTLPKETKDELDALERDIEEKLAGKVAPIPAPTPVAPAPLPGQPQPQPVITPPVVPQPNPAVPQKFQKPDGTLDQEKLAQARVNLQDYLNSERELTRLRQGPVQQQLPMIEPTPPGYQAQPGMYPVAQPQQPPPGYYPQQASPAPAPGQQQPQYYGTPFEAQVAQGVQTNPVGTLINLQQASLQAANAHTDQQLRSVNMQLELMQIAQTDPSIFTAPRLAQLQQIRVQNPWLDHSPTPWLSAYQMSNGGVPVAGAPSQASVVPQGVPLPAGGQRPTAPMLGGGQPPSQPVPSMVPQVNTQADLNRFLELKYPGNPQAQADYLEQVINRAGHMKAPGVL